MHDSHQKAAEYHSIAAHAHRTAAHHHGQEDHLTGHERSRQALDSLTHLPRNDIPSGILSSNVTFLRATYFVPAVCDDRANQFFEKSCIRPMRPENARN